VICGAGPEEICALCDEWTRKGVEPAIAALGMGLCQASEPGKARVHVPWDGPKCVSFRLDKPNLGVRRRYVEQQRTKEPAPP
jgi:hypothetical protein